MSSRLTNTTAFAPGIREEAVSFEVDGVQLCGNLTHSGNPSSTVLVFAHGWSGYRNGPHGLITWLARQCAGCGFSSLRFDFRGRGESEGAGLEATLVTMAEDLQRASEFAVERTGAEAVVYVGVCSGGNVVIGSLPRLPGVKGLFLLSVYPFSDGDAFSRDVHRTWHYAGIYFRKALCAETWKRLLKGDIHFAQVLNVLFGHLFRRGRNRAKEGRPDSESPAAKVAKPTALESRTQDKAAPTRHLRNLRADCPVLMIYGTADPDAPAARTYFGDYAREHSLPVTVVDIEGANHNFSSMAWKQQIADLLLRRFLPGNNG